MEYFCVIILKSVHWSRRRCHLKVFSIFALVAILFSGVEQFWQRVTQGTCLRIYSEISPLVLEEMSFKGFFYF